MATLEDAAEALVVKLRGLDSEIEDSEHRLQELRGQIEGAAHDVEQEWTALTEAVSSFLIQVHEEQDRLDQGSRQALQAAAEAQQAVASAGAEARSEIEQGQARLQAVTQHATALKHPVESLAAEAGEAPAHSLAQRAAQIEQELAQALEEARDFIRNDVVHALEQAVENIRDRSQAVRQALAQEHAQALQAVFDEWQSKVVELEEYVSAQGFAASQQHAHGVVEYALGECRTGLAKHLDEARQVVEVLIGQLQELAAEVRGSGEALVQQAGSELGHGLEAARDAVNDALAALGSTRDRLASYSFVEM